MRSVLYSSIFLVSLCFFGIFCDLRQLRDYTLTGPMKIEGVEDGSNLYLCSSDNLELLSKITISSTGSTVSLDKLRTTDGYLTGFPVNSDVTLTTLNTRVVTEKLTGILFISTREMARDPNFFVYSAYNSTKLFETSSETTLVILNPYIEKQAADPNNKPFYNSRIENIAQPKTTKLSFYRGVPENGYQNTENVDKLIFVNPVKDVSSHNDKEFFFETIEPIQFSDRAWYIRALGGVRFRISQEWKDPTIYNTSKATTTGFTMSQLHTLDSTVNFFSNPNHVGVFGLLVTTELFADVNVTMWSSSNNDSNILPMHSSPQMISQSFEWNMNVEKMYMTPSRVDSGAYYLQYFRIDITDESGRVTTSPQNVSSTSPSLMASSTKMPETTTKSTSMSSFVLALIIAIAIQL